ncbi:MAG TPA: hypothetical protein VIV60_12540 [Polyangiaceae bacterium]
MKQFTSIALGIAFLDIAVSAAAQTAQSEQAAQTAQSEQAAQTVQSEQSAQAVAPEPPTLLPESNSPSVAVAPQPLYRYHVRARTVGRRLEIRSLHDVPIARCVTRCSLDLPSGDYQALFYDAQGEAHAFEFSVSGPGAIEIEDPDDGAATVALGFGVAGIGLVAGGWVLMAVGLNQPCTLGECEPDQRTNKGGIMLLSGFGAMVAGGIMTPLGFYYWARHRNPRLHEQTKDIDVALAPTKTGVVFGLSGKL